MSDFEFLALIVLGFVAAAAVIWFILNLREKGRAAAGQPRHSAVRLVFGAIALLVMIFTGGCALIFIPDAMKGNQYVGFDAIAVLAGIPFAVALLIFWLAMRRGKAAPDDSAGKPG
jgi:NO-binding membrane sensor protein with MHYT domain